MDADAGRARSSKIGRHRLRHVRFPARATSRAIRRPTRSGYVRYPNVNSLIETMDMREAQRHLRSQPQRRHRDPAACSVARIDILSG